MNLTIPAIQTRYHGCHFRSRLEARWAVFFDSLGIKWEYEKQGYDLGAEYGLYLPDFWLPVPGYAVPGYWLEVKGTAETDHWCRTADEEKIIRLVDLTMPTRGYLVIGPPDVKTTRGFQYELSLASNEESRFMGVSLVASWLTDFKATSCQIESACGLARFEFGETPEVSIR